MEQAIEAIFLWWIRHHNSSLTPLRANGEVNPLSANLTASWAARDLRHVTNSLDLNSNLSAGVRIYRAMQKILISSCLLGNPVRYNGLDAKLRSDILDRWTGERQVVSVCPEVAAGFSVPRRKRASC